MPLDALIAKVEERLDTLEVKPSSPTALRELLGRLDGKIREAQEKGYSVGEIVELILECGLKADREDLTKNLMRALEPKRKKPSAKRARPRAKKAAP
jgi:hypothetical protein